ncbi:MAG: SDR family oxidoreductase [Myxococcales bacterium]|nr:SDR family oxidoreductase [Myxococcales bacterium]MCB9628788.1 SDR family oxidoreductase [Sandaracinaceae bacterium]
MSAFPVRDTFAGKHVVVTGVTGFVGKVWLAMLLDYVPEVRRVTVLGRGKKGQDAAQRFEQIYRSSPVFRPLRERLGQELYDLMDQKVEVLDAKLSEPLCGLEPWQARELMADVDVVVHFAGLTDFEPDPQLAIDANIHGARHVADLAALSPSGRYVHCSTCFVAGMRSGHAPETLTRGLSPNGTRFDPEQEVATLEAALRALPSKADRLALGMERAKRLGWPNVYTFTKALSEHLLEGREDIQTTTVRPAIVECAERYPFAGWNEGINTSGPLVWLMGTVFRRLPVRHSVGFDIIPVDMVCRGTFLAAAAALRDESLPIYQLGTGGRNRLDFERALDLSNLAIRRQHRRSEDPFTRYVLSQLSAYSASPDKEYVLGVKQTKRLMEELRNTLKDLDVRRLLPPATFERHGERLTAQVREWSTDARNQARKLKSVEDMLRQFRPFIWDHDYHFETEAACALTERLDRDELPLFGFDVDDLDWRDYYINVQVPGLETWCIPLLRGEKIPVDPPLPARAHPKPQSGEHRTRPAARLSA